MVSEIKVDEPAKTSNYKGKSVFILNNTDVPGVTQSQGIVNLNLP